MSQDPSIQIDYLPLDASVAILYSCTRCGCVVRDKDTHNMKVHPTLENRPDPKPEVLEITPNDS